MYAQSLAIDMTMSGLQVDWEIPQVLSWLIPYNSFNRDQAWLVRLDGKDAHILLGEDQMSYSDLSWSPDGKFILYSRYDYQNLGKFDIGLVDIQSDKQTILIRVVRIRRF
jgi:Tol biopolymer transport system component